MIGSKNITVSNIMSNANFGFELETVGSLGRDGEGEVTLNDVTIDSVFQKLLHGYEGAMAIQIYVAPIMSSAATTQAIGDG